MAQTVLYTSLTPDLTFRQAFELWLDHRTIENGSITTNASYLARNTFKDYRASARALGRFFDRLKLGDIHVGHIVTYQNARATCDSAVAAWKKPAGANLIRKEVTLLKRILTEAGCWKEIQSKTLPVIRPVETNTIGAMTPEEQHIFLHTAASREDWQYIYWYSLVALQTTASTDELRAVRLGDILLRDGVLRICKGKNRARIRTIPLVTPDVAWALERLIARAKDMGAHLPSHFLFPFRIKTNEYDPTRPMGDSGMKKSWDKVRVAAGMPRLRIYDLRHTGITRMAEVGTPIAIIMSFAGHLTVRMQQHYTAISMMAQRGWAKTTWQENSVRGPGARKPVASVDGQFAPVVSGSPFESPSANPTWQPPRFAAGGGR